MKTFCTIYKNLQFYFLMQTNIYLLRRLHQTICYVGYLGLKVIKVRINIFSSPQESTSLLVCGKEHNRLTPTIPKMLEFFVIPSSDARVCLKQQLHIFPKSSFLKHFVSMCSSVGKKIKVIMTIQSLLHFISNLSGMCMQELILLRKIYGISFLWNKEEIWICKIFFSLNLSPSTVFWTNLRRF